MDPGNRDAYASDNPPPEMITSGALRTFEQELLSYCMADLEGRSFLVAGHRGSGKTTLVKHAVYQLLAAERLLDSWAEKNLGSIPAHKRENLRRIAVTCLPPDQARDLPPDKLPSLSPAQVGQLRRKLRRPFLIEMHAPSLFPEGRLKDSEELTTHALTQIVRALYQGLADELTNAYRTRMLDRRGDAEFAAQLRMLRFQPMTAGALRDYWVQSDRLQRGVLFANAQVPHEDQALRELIALDSAGQAFAGVQKRENGQARSTETADAADTVDRASDQPSEKKEGFWASWSKPVLSLLAAGILGGGARTVPGVDNTTAFIVGASALLVTALVSLYLQYRLESSARRVVSRPLTDTEAPTLEQMLRGVLQHVREAHLAPIFLVDELDKVPQLAQRMEPLVRSLKKLCAEKALFCFLTDRGYLEYLSQIDQGATYSLEHTYFSQRLDVLLDLGSVRAFVRRGLNRSGSPIETQGFIPWKVAHESRGLAIDIKRGIDQYNARQRTLYSESSPVSGKQSYRTLDEVVTQLAIERISHVHRNAPDPERFIRDALYYPSTRRTQGQDQIDLRDTADDFDDYLRACRGQEIELMAEGHARDLLVKLDAMARSLATSNGSGVDLGAFNRFQQIAQKFQQTQDYLGHADRTRILVGIDLVLDQLPKRPEEANGHQVTRTLLRQVEALRDRVARSDPLPAPMRGRLRAITRHLCEVLSDPSPDRPLTHWINDSESLGDSRLATMRPPLVRVGPDQYRWRGDDDITHGDRGNGRPESLPPPKPPAEGTSPDSGRTPPPKRTRREPAPIAFEKVSEAVQNLTGQELNLSLLDELVGGTYTWPEARQQVLDLDSPRVRELPPESRAEKREIVHAFEQLLGSADHLLLFTVAAAELLRAPNPQRVTWHKAIQAVQRLFALHGIHPDTVAEKTRTLQAFLKYSRRFDVPGGRPVPNRNERRLTHRNGATRWRQALHRLLDLARRDVPAPADLQPNAWDQYERRLQDHFRKEPLLVEQLADRDVVQRVRLSNALLSFGRTLALDLLPGARLRFNPAEIPTAAWSTLLAEFLMALAARKPASPDIVPYWFGWPALLALGLGEPRLARWYRCRTRHHAPVREDGRRHLDRGWVKMFAGTTPRERTRVLVLLGAPAEDQPPVADWLPPRTDSVLALDPDMFLKILRAYPNLPPVDAIVAAGPIEPDLFARIRGTVADRFESPRDEPVWAGLPAATNPGLAALGPVESFDDLLSALRPMLPARGSHDETRAP